MKRCCISLLGNMRVTLDGQPLQGLESVKVRALLAYLAVERDVVHEREQLASLFWPEMTDTQARHSLSQALYNLRISMGEAGKTGELLAQPGSASQSVVTHPFLLITPHSVQFNPQSDTWLDVRDFNRCISAVRKHRHRHVETCEACASLLKEAEHLYQGDFLASLALRDSQAFEEWSLLWRERLRLQLCGVLSDLTSYYERRDDLQKALEMTERLTQIDPFSEPGQRNLMRLFALNGQRTQALARYTGFRRLLEAELGVEPERETQALYEHILTEETDQGRLPGMGGKLPVPLTPFIGRSSELAELAAALRHASSRLITILGPGGSGKTRLALQAVRRLHYDFPDGIFLVSLSGLGSAEAFLPALASALGVVFQANWGDPFEQLLSYLQRRHLLLILDSFEEAVSAIPWVSRLLQSTTNVQILITSRARLNLQSEQVFTLEGMPYPNPAKQESHSLNIEDYSALQLFHSAAHFVRPDYTPSLEDLPHIVRICQLVNGMPLGLVLAAGWLETCSPAEIVAEIEHSIDFLSSSWNDVPERQRSLRATLDHSWQMLNDAERQIFEKLSIFHGAFTRQAAEKIAQVSPAVLRGLVDKSMLQTSQGSYRMHDLLRQYAAEKLQADCSSAIQVRDTHSAYYLESFSEREARLKSAQRSAMLREMDAEINDLQAAWKWACSQANIPLLARSLGSVCMYYEMRVRYKEGIEACLAGLACLAGSVCQPASGKAATELAVLHARLMLWQAHYHVLLGELDTAGQMRQQAAELLDTLEAQAVDVRRPRAMYWQSEGEAQADTKIKLAYYQRSIALYQELGDAWRQASMLVWAGEFAIRVGDASLAMHYQQEGLRLARQVGEPSVLLHSLRQITFLHFFLNQYETANQFIQETSALVERVDELPLRVNTNLHLGVTLTWNGRYPEAIQTLESTLPQLRSLGYHYGVTYIMLPLTLCYLMVGKDERAEALARAAVPEADQGGFHREAAGIITVLGMAKLKLNLPVQAQEAFRESVDRYRRMQYPGELCWALGGLALAQEALGQPEAARDTLLEALRIAAKTPNVVSTMTGLPAMARLLANRGQTDIALLVHCVARSQTMQRNSRWYAEIIGDELSAILAALPEEQRTAINTKAQQHNPFSIIPEVLAVLAKDENSPELGG